MSWLWVILALVALFYLAIPLLIWKTFRIEKTATIRRIDPADLPLPSEVQQHLDAVGDELSRLGFESRGTLLLPSATPNVISLLRIFVNRSDKVSAMANSIITTVKTKVAEHVRHQPYVEFTTRYVDGKIFNTLNSEAASSFPPPSQTLTTRVPWIKDVTKLYQAHDAISAARSGGVRKILRLDESFAGDEVAFLQSCMKEELQRATEAGYLRRSPGNTHYVATLSGAYLMTWKELPPMKQFLARRSRGRTERLLGEVGIG
jgi:hypothetical protein